MAAKKSAAKKVATPPTKTPDGPVIPDDTRVVSATGAEMIDGLPYFATLNGVKVNRRQWIEATRPQRKAALVAELRAEAEALAADAAPSEE